VARAIAALMQDRARGVFQLSGQRDITYADAARYLAERLNADPELVKAVSARSRRARGQHPASYDTR
jgi:dTDP-4-dehydrorhamnose reductase